MEDGCFSRSKQVGTLQPPSIYCAFSSRELQSAPRRCYMAAAPIPPNLASTADPESPPLSESARIVDIFIAPSKTFTDLHRNASWWAPWLLISISSLAFVFVM